MTSRQPSNPQGGLHRTRTIGAARRSNRAIYSVRARHMPLSFVSHLRGCQCPKPANTVQGIDPGALPPRGFTSGAINLAVMTVAQANFARRYQ
jgi:hypothetical protein